MCVVEAFVLMKRAIDCKTKTKIYNLIFTSNYYHNWPVFKIKKGLCVLVDKSWSFFLCQARISGKDREKTARSRNQSLQDLQNSARLQTD